MRTIIASQITTAYWTIPKNDPKRQDWNQQLKHTITNLTTIGIFPKEDQPNWENAINNGTPNTMVEHYHNQNPDKTIPQTNDPHNLHKTTNRYNDKP